MVQFMFCDNYSILSLQKKNMKYFSTRDKNLDLTFKEIFFKGLSQDGGLFLPKNIPVISSSDLKKFSNYNFQEMSYEIFSLFVGDTFSQDELRSIIDKAYATFRNDNIVDIKKLDHISFVKLHRWASEYVNYINKISVLKHSDDFVIATGKTFSLNK